MRDFSHGLLSDLANPKIGIFVAMTVVWLQVYTLVAGRAAQTLMRPRLRAALDRFTGVVLIGLGLRLAVERR